TQGRDRPGRGPRRGSMTSTVSITSIELPVDAPLLPYRSSRLPIGDRKGMAMKFYETTATIQASPDTIWAILSDGAGYTDWDSGVVRVEGRIAPGEKIKVVSSANPKRAFPVKVTEFTPGSSMTWTGGMPLGLFRGVR